MTVLGSQWYSDTMLSTEYLAGLFDGEGCVSINKVTARRYGRPGFQLRASISITHEETSRTFRDRFGGTHVLRQRSNARPYWQWVTVARVAKDCLKELEPFLIIKKDVARAGIDFQEYRDKTLRGRKTDEQWEIEFEYYERVRRGNARWGGEYFAAPDNSSS